MDALRSQDGIAAAAEEDPKSSSINRSRNASHNSSKSDSTGQAGDGDVFGGSWDPNPVSIKNLNLRHRDRSVGSTKRPETNVSPFFVPCSYGC